MLNIRKAAVIGAGNMGAQIAAHLANVGIPSLLLDVVPRDLTPEEQQRGAQTPAVRNRLTRTLLERALKLSPKPLFLTEAARLIQVGNVEDDLPRIAEVDWVVEAVLEKMELKQELHGKIARLARPDALVTSNTSGLSIAAMTEGLPVEHRRRFFGTHFFNPPRYMRLLELIPTRETDPTLLEEFSRFAEAVLGKGIVHAKDTPGFIANRIGCFDMQTVLWLTLREDLAIDEVDALTGPVIGRPKSATFRLGDIVGVDLMVQMGQNLRGLLTDPEEVKRFDVPDFVRQMVERGWWGEKKGQGFYKRVKTDRGSEILTLDYKTLEYRPRAKAQFPSLEAAARIQDTGERIRTLCQAADKAGKFVWDHLSAVLCYAAERMTEIADDVVTVDNAMRWGYNWELGPFETWDALGVAETARRLEKEGRAVPALAGQLLRSGWSTFYEAREARPFYFDTGTVDYVPVSESPRRINLKLLRHAKRVVRGNKGASVLDLGDGVACLELHTKLNIIGPDQLAMLRESIDEVRANFVGLVIGNQAEHFSAGANLLFMMTQIQNQEWDGLDQTIRMFQDCMGSLRQFEKPVVAACHGYTLGGGCEMSFGADYIVAAAECYLGLPETGVGLIPAGGGTKEMLIRSTEHVPRGEETDYQPYLRRAWETVGLAKVSTSAAEALQLGYLRPSETRVVLNRDWVIGEAKAQVLHLANSGYRPSPQRTDLPAVGRQGLAVFRLLLHQMTAAGQISAHDHKVGEKLAYVLCGGDLSSLQYVSEQYILDLEREVFLSLCGEPKTLERIQHTLKTGKPFRN